tara:strand:- start:96 stop:410 length:315 start_codon:yes stop_codon:yes gene_type:complete
MSTRIIGRAREGRRIASNATGAGTVKTVELKAPIGDGTTADSATPFLKLTGGAGAGTTGAFNVTTSDPTGGGATPAGTEKGVMITVKDAAGDYRDYWLAIYPTV